MVVLYVCRGKTAATAEDEGDAIRAVDVAQVAVLLCGAVRPKVKLTVLGDIFQPSTVWLIYCGKKGAKVAVLLCGAAGPKLKLRVLGSIFQQRTD